MKRNDTEMLEIDAVTAQKFNIEFLFDGSEQHRTSESLKSSNLASVRMRTYVAMHALDKLNWKSTLSDGKNNKHADMLIVGKVTNKTDQSRPNRWLNRITKIKKNNGKIIIDYTDHHLETNSDIGDFYKLALPLADLVVCSSTTLAKHVMPFTNAPTLVIEEPVEITPIKPIEKNNSITTILWFGHASNLSYLVDFLCANINKEVRAKLILMTNAYPLPKIYEDALNKPQFENFDINVVPWGMNDMIKAAQISDFCILPTGHNDPRKSGASSNRLLTALALGLPTMADSLESYKPFRDYFIPLSAENLMQMIKKPASDIDAVIKAQELISRNFTLEMKSEEWASILSDVSNSSSQCKPVEQPIKLNLGCGDKILNGYINVDVVDARAGKKPDIICDLHDLGLFETNSVDEILAVHVVEHFWQWEVIDILKEWVRVLKPGGKMILECPNLVSAAEEFLKNADIAAMGGPEGQRSMWVFYGDPAWKDPLMIHRWGYTPRSLAMVMKAAGLNNLQQEPAQFKLREPRDMRITGIKFNRH